MPSLRLPIFRGDHSDLTPDWRDLLPVNMFYVPKPILGAPGYLRSSWGLESFGTASGADRGGYYNALQATHFRVSGTDLTTVSSTGATAILGTVPLSDQVSMIHSFSNQCVTNNGASFLYNTSDEFRQITDPDLGPVFDTTFNNQRLIHTDGEFLIPSDVGQDDAYNPLNYGGAETNPDGILGVGTLYNKLIAFGRHTIEWYVDLALEFFPYQRIETQLIDVGIVATHAKCQFRDNDGNPTYAFIGSGTNEPLAVRVVGQANAPKISTREVDIILEEYTEEEFQDARLEARKIENNDLLVIHLPRHTLQYDRAASVAMNEPLWTIQKTDIEGDDPSRWINGVYDPRISTWIYGDKIDGRLGALNKDICTQYGDVVEEIFYSPMANYNRRSIHELFLEDLPGRANASENPRIFLSATKNGLTYGNETLLSLGQQGDYEKNFYARKLGYVKNYLGFKFRKANDLPIAVAKLTVEIG